MAVAGADPTIQHRIQTKEARVRALEKELDEFDSNLKAESKGARPIKNWPCQSYAFARNAIDIDIPIQYQKATRKFYYLWWWTVLCTLVNWLAIIWYGSMKDYSLPIQDYLFVSLYVVVGTPLSWMFLYKRFYKAMQENGALSSLFFFFLFAHLVWTIIMALGLISIEGAGWLIMAKVFVDKHNMLGVIMLISAMLWSINALISIYMMKVAQYSYGMYLANRHQQMAENFTA
mmetsp:Transcript_59195/g.97808  ORF Transcript_59195/g.97808 Transcript_59195/m.97808 type:complete len:232 (-) Transcript_59195:211-906(-)|eukprot:CAMPEP_0202700346 /NCGR_PEP_ID=MMETSP1385-20130828/13530_1 /ASSEMBLY_ACC=CAM_ASM_000861 /TAXON_ID=933848 /ORGANISM="Elphidium margaritaceum" /LENGTH=231 /DNA_ID=CAMNT_0049357501 /DNA_START=32 /DNA_END=727 /DNA_ORIENTATION=-